MGLFSSFSRKPVPASPVLQELSVGERILPLKIVENQRSKRLTLRIDAGGRGVRVTIPPGISRREVDLFIARHAGWLESRIARYPDQPAVRPGVRIPLRGVAHLIVHHPGKRGLVETGQQDGALCLHVYGDPQHLSRRIRDFLKREAKRDIEALVAHHTARIGRKAKSIRFKDTTSRWGSCAADGGLSFSWRIMMAPPAVIDYLVAHEVAHLREMNHGPRFWALCRELCPETDRCKAWLKKNGGALQAIAFE